MADTFADELFPYVKETKFADELFPDPELVTGPAADSWWTTTTSGQVLNSFGVGASQAWGAVGESETKLEEYLRQAGIWNDYKDNQQSISKAMNEAWMRPALRFTFGAAQPVAALLQGSVGAIEAYGEAHETKAQEYLTKQPETFLGAVEKTLGTPFAVAEGMTAEAIKAAPDYLPAHGANLSGALGTAKQLGRYNTVLDILKREEERVEPTLTYLPSDYNVTPLRQQPQARSPVDVIRGPLRYTGQTPSLAEFQAARSRGLIGEGEQGFFNTTPLSEEQIATRNQAANDAGVPPPKPKPPVFDVDKVAREAYPDLFTEYDALKVERDGYRQKVQEYTSKARQHPQAKAIETEIDSILAKVNYIEGNLSKKQLKKVKQLEKILEAYHVSDDANIAEVNRSFLENPDAEIPVVRDTPEISELRRKILETDQKLRDLGPQVARAREHAHELIPQAIDPPKPQQSETSALVETPSSGVAKTEEPATVSFKTSKGSSYQAHSDGSTTRNKSYHPEHGPSDVGPKPKSEKTIYVTKEQLEKIGEFQTQGGPSKILAPLGDGRWGLKYTEGENKGKFEARTVITPTDVPSKGLSPVEVWDKGQKVHFGNEITEVGQPVSESMATAVEAETKPTVAQQTPAETHVTPGQKAFIVEDKLIGSTGQMKVRALSRRIADDRAVRELFARDGDLPEMVDYYDVLRQKEQHQAALDYTYENYDKVKRIIQDGEDPPKGILRSSLVDAFKEYALAVGDSQAFRDIGNGSFAGREQTFMGQYLAMLKKKDPYSPEVAVQGVKENRERAAAAQGIDVKKEMTGIEERVDNLLKNGVTQKDLEDFVLSIICK